MVTSGDKVVTKVVTPTGQAILIAQPFGTLRRGAVLVWYFGILHVSYINS